MYKLISLLVIYAFLIAFSLALLLIPTCSSVALLVKTVSRSSYLLRIVIALLIIIGYSLIRILLDLVDLPSFPD
jgi:hypothetical protein